MWAFIRSMFSFRFHFTFSSTVPFVCLSDFLIFPTFYFHLSFSNKNVTDNWFGFIVVWIVYKYSVTLTSVSSNGANISILPNKSSLFGNSNSVNTNSIGVMKSTTTATAAAAATVTPATTTNKVVPNYGKPTCAPKPPVTAKNGLSALTTTNNGNGPRTSVSRSQSVRAPRFVHQQILYDRCDRLSSIH